jgi:cobalamin biosynthesis Mg chelatase CobN
MSGSTISVTTTIVSTIETVKSDTVSVTATTVSTVETTQSQTTTVRVPTTRLSTIETTESGIVTTKISTVETTESGTVTTTISTGIDGATSPKTSETEPITSSTPVGAIVGGAIGGLVLVAAVVLGWWFCVKRKHKRTERSQDIPLRRL